MVVHGGVDHGDDDIATYASEGPTPTHDGDLIGGEVDEALEAEGAIGAGPIIIRHNLHLHLMAGRSVAGLHRVAAHVAEGLGHIRRARGDVEVEHFDRPEAVGGVIVEGRCHLPRVRGPHHHLHIILERRVPDAARVVRDHHLRVVAARALRPRPMHRS